MVVLRPYHANFGKRLVKSPKVYFLDTGVACFLVGLHDEEAVLHGPMMGSLFETAVVAEFVKALTLRAEPLALWFWRTSDELEVDLLVERGGSLHPVEAKATATPRPAHADAMRRWRDAAGPRAAEGLVMANVAAPGVLASSVRAVPWDSL